MIFFLVPVLTFSQYIVPSLDVVPSIDGKWDDVWEDSIAVELGEILRSIHLLVHNGEIYILLKLERSALYYVGKSIFLEISVGNSCEGFSEKVLIPFKVWKGRAYVFEETEEGVEISGFVGVGLGDYVEMSLPFSGNVLCVLALNSRNWKVLERHEIYLKRSR